MAARADGEPVPASFDELKPYVAEAIAEMTSGGADPVLIVNSDKNDPGPAGGARLRQGPGLAHPRRRDQAQPRLHRRRLTISYFRRKAGQADTLMQAGRWFGFREGYRDLVRLYIRRDHQVDLYEAFEALLLDEEAFRDELGKYAGLDEDGKPHRRAASDPAARQPAPAVAEADRPQQDVQRGREGPRLGRRVPPAVVDSPALAPRRRSTQPSTRPISTRSSFRFSSWRTRRRSSRTSTPTARPDKQQHARVGLIGADEFLALSTSCTGTRTTRA